MDNPPIAHTEQLVEQVIALKNSGQGVAAYTGCGQPGDEALAMAAQDEADLLIEASTSNLVDGQPGLGCIEMALSRGMDVVSAN